MSFALRFYPFFYWLLWLTLRFWHWPTFRGRENLPEGPCVLCCNHSGFADPLWVFLTLGVHNLPWTMAKKSVMQTPVLGKFLAAYRAFAVDRDNPDMTSIKKSLRVLRDGDRLLIFPEGTRVKHGKQVQAKSGAVMLAHRAGVPVVPIYLTPNRRPFMPIRCEIGKAYTPEFADKRATAAELEQATTELMAKIYAMGEKR